MGHSGAYDRPLRMTTRGDLVIRERADGSAVIKDPVTLSYYQATPEELWILRRLRQPDVTLRGLRSELERLFFPKRTSYQELNNVLGLLGQRGLMRLPSDGRLARQWLDKAKRTKWREQVQNINPLFLRVVQFDPTFLLDISYPVVRPFLSGWALALWVLWFLISGLLILANVDHWTPQIPDWSFWFDWSHLPPLAITLAFAKVCHEWGHALACRHFNAECRSIGLALYLGVPCVYCDTTDAWMLKERSKRLFVAGAGVMVELTLAMIAAFVWYFSRNPATKEQCLYALIACSTSTLVFNMNPLLRYDGYYALADTLGIANLWTRSRRYISTVVFSYLAGLRLPVEKGLTPRLRLFFLVFASASIIYRTFVIVLAFWMLSQLLDAARLQWMAWLVLVVLLSVGFWRSVEPHARYLMAPMRRHRVRKLRSIVLGTSLLAIVGYVASIPLPRSVEGSAYLISEQSQLVYIETNGVLTELLVTEGASVTTGQVLAKLTNVELEAQSQVAAAELAAAEERLQGLIRLRGNNTEASSRLPSAEAYVEQLKAKCQLIQDQMSKLVLRANREGIVHLMSPSGGNISRQPAIVRPQFGSMQTNVGQLYRQGEIFCEIASPSTRLARCEIDETHIDSVQLGANVRLRLTSLPATVLAGRVIDLAAASRNRDGRDERRLVDQKSRSEASPNSDSLRQNNLAQRTSFEITIQLDQAEANQLPGMHGTARITAPRLSLASQALKTIRDVFQF